VLDAARRESADLIVLGLHHVHPLEDIFVGCTAERIVRNSAIPILMVKDKPSDGYGKVLVATDFSPSSSHALRAALDLAPDAEFQLLHVFETPFRGFIHFSQSELEDYRRERVEGAMKQAEGDLDAFLRTHVADRKPSVTISCKRGEATSVIGSTANQMQADLLVLGTHGRGGLSKLLLGSVAVMFLTDPPCDVLVSR
jgi:nucleotide-binding universal stress UspA family protein